MICYTSRSTVTATSCAVAPTCAVLPWLKAYWDWMEDRARQNHWRGSLLWLARCRQRQGD